MSAKLCGCDLEQDYVCEQHRTEPQEYGNVYERDALGGLPDETICAGKPATERAWYREHVTKTAENLMAMQPAREATPIEESLIDVQRVADRLVKELQALVASVETLQVERDMFALRSKTLEQQFADFTKVNSGWEQEHVIWRNDRRHIIDVLSAFVHAPISLSSLQPVLDLRVEPESEGAPMKDYDSTVARIAGNIASGMELTIAREPEDEARSAEEIIAIVAVKVARAIIAELKRTEPQS